jgi:hypothetical protein
MKNNNKLLLDENPLVILPKFAKLIGLQEAIFLQQLHYWLMNYFNNKKYDHCIEDKWWIWNSYEEWQEQMPWWSERTIRRIIKRLRDKGLIIAKDALGDDKFNRSLWYTIDYDLLDEFTSKKSNRPEEKDVQELIDEEQNKVDKVDSSRIRELDTCTYTENTTKTNNHGSVIEKDFNSSTSDQNLVSSLVQVAEPKQKDEDGFEELFPKRSVILPPERQFDLSTPEGREAAQIKSIENRIQRPQEQPWLNWYANKIYPRDGINKRVLQRVGWLFENVTGRYPKSDKEWRRYRLIYATMYLESEGDFELLEKVFHEKWDDPEFRTYDPQKYIDAINVAAAERKVDGDGQRINKSLVLR